jgi:hypothetical protein
VRCGRNLARAMLFVFGFYRIREDHRRAAAAQVPNSNLDSGFLLLARLLDSPRYLAMEERDVVRGRPSCSCVCCLTCLTELETHIHGNVTVYNLSLFVPKLKPASPV